MEYIRRSFLRKYREALVLVQPDGAGHSHPAQMCDCCGGGMQLISENFIKPGSQVIINSGEPRSDTVNGALEKGYRAEVVWCQSHHKGAPNRFLIGVRFVPPPKQ